MDVLQCQPSPAVVVVVGVVVVLVVVQPQYLENKQLWTMHALILFKAQYSTVTLMYTTDIQIGQLTDTMVK